MLLTPQLPQLRRLLLTSHTLSRRHCIITYIQWEERSARKRLTRIHQNAGYRDEASWLIIYTTSFPLPTYDCIMSGACATAVRIQSKRFWSFSLFYFLLLQPTCIFFSACYFFWILEGGGMNTKNASNRCWRKTWDFFWKEKKRENHGGIPRGCFDGRKQHCFRAERISFGDELLYHDSWG